MATPARLNGLATAVPRYVMRQADALPAAARLFSKQATVMSPQRLARIFGNTAIESRYTCQPLEWYLQPHDFSERNRLYLQHASALLQQAATGAMDDAGLTPADIDIIVTISSTGIATPSLDALLVDRMPFRRDVQRLPVFGLGCAGGVQGLARAAALARGQPGARVLLLVVELCSLTLRHGDRSKSNIIATALFGDGAASAVISTTGTGPAITAWGEHTWPDTLDVMGWDAGNDGLRVIFSRDIPTIVERDFRQALDEFLTRQGLSREQIDHFIAHPGGAKVLDALEGVFGLPAGGLIEAREVMRRHGNMSAVTVLFVLEELRQAGLAPDRRLLLTSMGPGFTAAFALMETD
ncbi:MAG: type III polyketide synthase [Alphaproteobacteria bacterium]|nr:type III polyketide synthase [Alphaproteobacteria bacterium]MBL6953672.1 type III polyketide synthase [Alphaproteobacteria bacterium]